MGKYNITNHSELLLQIAALKTQSLKHEEQLKTKFKEFAVTVNPVAMIKNSVMELAVDKQLQSNLLKVGLNLGTTFLLDKVLGRNKTVKGFFGSVLAETITTSVINNTNVSKIISGVSDFLREKSNDDLSS